MIKRRRFAASTVFEGKVVVSGGDDVDIFSTPFRSVESFDHHDDKWIYLPVPLQSHTDFSMNYILINYKSL